VMMNSDTKIWSCYPSLISP